MFGFVSYVKNLTPRLDKNTVLSEINSDKENLQDFSTLLLNYADYFNGFKPESSEVINLSKFYLKNYKGSISKDAKQYNNDSSKVLAIMAGGLTNAIEIMDTLSDIADKNLPDVIVRNGSSVKTAAIIKVNEIARNALDSSVTILKYISIFETNIITGDKNNRLLTNVELKSIKSTVTNNASSIAYFKDLKISNFKSDLAKITDDVIITQDSDEVTDSLINKGMSKIHTISDIPVVSNFIGNPIYHLRLIIADYQIDKHNKRKEYKKTLELKLLYLKSLSKGEENPNLEKQIDYYEKKVAKLTYKLRQLEDEVK